MALSRPLTDAEWRALSPGLAAALRDANIDPLIIARPSLLAIVASLWRGRTPIMVIGHKVFWPRASDDFSDDAPRMAVLQHELQHVLEYTTGKLSMAGYAIDPRNWIYGYRLTPQTRWEDLGAEQRAMVVQHYWLAGKGLLGGADPERLAALIPWASENAAAGADFQSPRLTGRA